MTLPARLSSAPWGKLARSATAVRTWRLSVLNGQYSVWLRQAVGDGYRPPPVPREPAVSQRIGLIRVTGLPIKEKLFAELTTPNRGDKR